MPLELLTTHRKWGKNVHGSLASHQSVSDECSVSHITKFVPISIEVDLRLELSVVETRIEPSLDRTSHMQK